MSGRVDAAQPYPIERPAPGSAAVLYGLAAVLAAGSAVPSLLAIALALSLPEPLDAVAGPLLAIGYIASFIGVSWLGPGIFVGIARRSGWTAVGVTFLLLVAQSTLLTLAFTLLDVPLTRVD